MTAPLLVVAIGNASRGDDALGPALAARLQAAGAFDDPARAELLEVFQLQVEDLLALGGRRGVLFVDAARRGTVAGVALSTLAPAPTAAATAFTHALAPALLLALHERVLGATPPPAWLLAIEGEGFELGASLSAAAVARLDQAFALASAWLATGSGAPEASQGAASVPSIQHSQPVHNV